MSSTLQRSKVVVKSSRAKPKGCRMKRDADRRNIYDCFRCERKHFREISTLRNMTTICEEIGKVTSRCLSS